MGGARSAQWIRMKIWERRFRSRSTVKLSTFRTDGRTDGLVDNCETLVLFRLHPHRIPIGSLWCFGTNGARF